jgi:hypothetical protein
MRHATARLVITVNISACLAGVGAGRLSCESGNLPDASGKRTLKIVDRTLRCA